MAKKKFLNSNAVFYLLAVLVIALVVWKFADPSEIVTIIKGIDLKFLLLALIAQAFTYFFWGNNFFTLLRVFNIQENFSRIEFWKLGVAVIFFNQIVPSGGLSGSTLVLSRLNKRGVPLSRGISIIVLELFTYYFVSLVAIALGVLLFRHFTGSIPGFLVTIYFISTIFFLSLTTIMSLVGSRAFLTRAEKFTSRSKFISGILNRFKAFAEHESGQFHETVNPWKLVLGNKAIFGEALLSQVAIFFLDVLTIYFIFFGLQLPLPFFLVMTGFALTLAVATIPITPGSLLTFEGSMVLFFTLLHANVHTALVAAILYRLLSFWLPLPAGLLMYRHLQKREEINSPI